MDADNLEYQKLKTLLSVYDEKGRNESVSFLNWFLENIYRLEPIEADDCICDQPNDKGIDAIYVDHIQEEILIFQSKIKQKEATVGDSPLRALAGTITQLSSKPHVQSLIDGGASVELKRILKDQNMGDLIEKGYDVVGVFVCNLPLDNNGKEFRDYPLDTSWLLVPSPHSVAHRVAPLIDALQ